MGSKLVDQLDQRHLCRVAFAIAQLEDARVAARPLHVSRRNIIEELTENVAILDLLTGQTPRVHIATTSEGYQPLGEGTELLGLRGRRLDPFVTEQRCGEISERGRAMTASPRELTPFLTVPHGLFLTCRRLGLFLDEEQPPVFAFLELHAEPEAVLLEEVGDLLE